MFYGTRFEQEMNYSLSLLIAHFLSFFLLFYDPFFISLLDFKCLLTIDSFFITSLVF